MKRLNATKEIKRSIKRSRETVKQTLGSLILEWTFTRSIISQIPSLNIAPGGNEMRFIWTKRWEGEKDKK